MPVTGSSDAAGDGDDPPSRSSPAELERVGVLVVDDRSEDLLVVDVVLASPRYDLVKVTSGSEALRHLLMRDFAVVLVDVHMPVMDGFELASLIRARPRSAHTPIIFLTGADADLGQIYRAYAAGAIDYLTKPVDPEVLRSKVALFADVFAMHRRLRDQDAMLLAVERRNRALELERVRLASTVRYRNLADAIPQMVWTADAAGSVTYRNRRWVEYTGHEHGAWLDVVHPDDRAECGPRWQRAVAEGAVFEAECRLRGADGVYRWHLCRALPDLNAEGAHVGWVASHTDIDELLRARGQAEAARRRSELVAEATAAMSANLDPTSGLSELTQLVVPVVADACIVELAGRDPDGAPLPPVVLHADPAQQAVLEQLAAQLGDQAVDARTRAFASGRPELIRGPRERVIHQLAEGELAVALAALRPVSVITVPIADPRGTQGTIILMTTETSGRALDLDDLAMAADLGRRAGVALENAFLYRRAERAVRLRDDFLSTASHELRTPLSALLIQLGGLERTIERDRPAVAEDGRVMKKVSGALRHTNRLTRLVDSLLDVSRLSARRLHMQPETIDLAELVRDVCDRFAEEARQAGCPLVVNAPASAVGTWDRMRLEQVITNLMSNAVKYGRGKPIEVELVVDDETATIVVTDHGIGIAAADQHRIFEQFERAVSTQNYGGLGLGLFISRQIVEAHGGSIAVASRPDAGATFRVALPRGGS